MHIGDPTLYLQLEFSEHMLSLQGRTQVMHLSLSMKSEGNRIIASLCEAVILGLSVVTAGGASSRKCISRPFKEPRCRKLTRTCSHLRAAGVANHYALTAEGDWAATV